MNFNKHSDLVGLHAYLGASKYSWLNYSDDKLVKTYLNHLAVQRGTRLHELAAEHIELGIKMPKTKTTLNMFINDAIGFKMKPEQVLFYSPNCFGTADAISFRNNLLRIHDLKTGDTLAHMQQLEIYAALFCLEYGFKPADIDIVLRIYQYDDYTELIPTSEDIVPIMDKIITFDKIISDINLEER